MPAKQALRLVALAGLAAPASRGAAEEPDFYRDVFPFFKANCISCHNKTTTKGGLDMESPASMRAGGDSGPGIVPGNGPESLVVEAARHLYDMEMPPKNNQTGAVDLTPGEVEILTRWIDLGAKDSVRQERQVAWQALPPGVHPIYSVAVTRDGLLAAAARSNRIHLHDLATREETGVISDPAEADQSAHRALIQALAFSPDGSRLASGSYREVKVWRQQRPSSSARPPAAGLGAILSTVSHDGQRLLSADASGTIFWQEAGNGELIRKIEGAGQGGILALALAPDVPHAAVLGGDGSLAVWDLESPRLLGRHGEAGEIRALSWTADGAFLATGGGDKILRLWTLPAELDSKDPPPSVKPAAESAAPASDAEPAAPAAEAPPEKEAPGGDGASRLVMVREFPATGGAIAGLAVAPGRIFTASEDGKVQEWGTGEAKLSREIDLPGVLGFAASPDGKLLAAGSSSGVIRVWDLAAGKVSAELRGGVEDKAKTGALEWNIAAQGLEQAFHQAQAARIEAQNKALDELLKKATDAIAAMGKVIPEKEKEAKPAQEAKAEARRAVDEIAAKIAGLPEGQADAALEKQLADAQEKLTAATAAETAALAAVSAAQSNLQDAEAEVIRISGTLEGNAGDLAAANAARDAAKQAQEAAAAELSAAKAARTESASPPLAAAFSQDARFVAAAFADGAFRVWALASGMPVEDIALAPSAAAALASRGGGFLACSAEGAVASAAGPPRWELERVFGGEGDPALFADRVNAVRFSPDGKVLAAGGGEPSRSGDVVLFDLENGEVLAEWRELHADAITSLDFSPDGKSLATGAADKIARVIDLGSEEQIHLFEGHTHHVTGVAFRADGRVLATAGADGTVVAWDLLLGERKRKIEGWTKEVTSLQFLGATNQILTSAGDNLVRVVNDEGGQVRSIAGLPDFMQAAASAPDASYILAGGEDSLLRVWKAADGEEIAVFGTR